MLWNRNKPTVPSRAAVNPTNSSGYRVAEPDRALTTIGTLLTLYGRFALDAAEGANSLRGRCEEWAQRLMLGEGRRPGAADEAPAANGAAAGVSRDFRGVERFFEEARKAEAAFVMDQLGGLRKAVLSLARSLGNCVGEDRDADAQVEQRLSALSSALEQGDVKLITRSATSVIETSRASMAQRRERESRHVQKLDQELRALRDKLSSDYEGASTDAATGLFGRDQYQQQLEHLTAIGALLAEPPWLLLLDVAAGKRDAGKKTKPVPDATLREVSHCISRTFLRRHDFAARPGAHQLAVLVLDMTQAEVVAATERLLGMVYSAGRSLGKSEAPSVSIGIARLRPNDDAERWEGRARVAVERAIQDGRDGYSLGA